MSLDSAMHIGHNNIALFTDSFNLKSDLISVIVKLFALKQVQINFIIAVVFLFQIFLIIILRFKHNFFLKAISRKYFVIVLVCLLRYIKKKQFWCDY